MELALGNIFARQGEIAVGGHVEGHTHNFDHVTACRAGRIRVIGKRGGQQIAETVLELGDVCLILADVEHTLLQEPGMPPQVAAALSDMRARLLEALPDAAAAIETVYAATVETHSNVPAKYSCIYAHREPQADGTTVVVQNYTGWDEAYR